MIHNTAEVQTQNIGANTKVWQYSIILQHAQIGDYCNINCHVFIENDVVLGDHITIKSGVYLWDGIRLDDYVFVGPNVTFTNNKHPRSEHYPGKHIGAHIKRGASIGAASIINSGVTIGQFAMVGAGSLVTKNIGDFTLWYGSPATHKGYVTRSGEVLDLNMMDKEGRKYKFDNEDLTLDI
jgi:UDP-2-acetamido-3-amino-2,3-dideoxy-glucuronate N-acetyltransferase